MFSSSCCNSNTVSPFQPNFPFPSTNPPPPPPPPPPPSPCVNLVTCTGDILFHHIHDSLCGQFSHQNISLMGPSAHQILTHLGVSSNTVPPSINAPVSSSCGDHHHHHHHHHQYSNYGRISSDSITPYFLHSTRQDVVVAPAKKDRHSKIFTAQGLRDRRVRLSIDVSRQFFDLQDRLGFDTASKTLEWLLNKSRKAIRDLGTRKNNLSCSSEWSKSLSSTSECKDVVPDINEVDNHVVSKEKEMVMMKLKESESAGAYVAKESRAKARARARERTRAKKVFITSRSPHQILNQMNLFNEQLNDHEKNISSSSKVNYGDHHVNQELGSLLDNQAHHHHCQEEDQSALIKRNKMKLLSSVVSNYNTTDQSSSSSYLQFTNSSQYWDINGAFPMPEH